MSVALLAPVKHPQLDEALSVIAILKHISRVEDAQHDLAIFIAPSDRTPEVRMMRQDLRLLDDLARHDPGKRGMMLMQEGGEAIEVGERVVRPFERHRSCHGL